MAITIIVDGEKQVLPVEMHVELWRELYIQPSHHNHRVVINGHEINETKEKTVFFKDGDIVTWGSDKSSELGIDGVCPASLPGDFSEKDIIHYSRNMLIPGVGRKGQYCLQQAKVLIIGAGGLGSPAALYLTAAGVGTIGIVDADVVDLSNLQRQIIHNTSNLNEPKVESAQAKLKALNPEVKVNTYHTYVTADNIIDIITDYDFVLDCTDNFQSKFLINDACVLTARPLAHAGIIRFQGQLTTYLPDKGPCYRCLFPDLPPAHTVLTGGRGGVMGALCGIVGSMQALEAIKYFLNVGELLNGYLLKVDGLTMEFRKMKLPRNPDCKFCGKHASADVLPPQWRELFVPKHSTDA